MKKSILVLLFTLFILQPLYANASIAYPDSVLSEPVSCNSQDLSSPLISMYAGDYIIQTIDLVYDVVPSSLLPSYTVTKTINGVTYSGTVYLQSTHMENNKFYATYHGTLYAQ